MIRKRKYWCISANVLSTVYSMSDTQFYQYNGTMINCHTSDSYRHIQKSAIFLDPFLILSVYGLHLCESNLQLKVDIFCSSFLLTAIRINSSLYEFHIDVTSRILMQNQMQNPINEYFIMDTTYRCLTSRWRFCMTQSRAVTNQSKDHHFSQLKLYLCNKYIRRGFYFDTWVTFFEIPGL